MGDRDVLNRFVNPSPHPRPTSKSAPDDGPRARLGMTPRLGRPNPGSWSEGCTTGSRLPQREARYMHRDQQGYLGAGAAQLAGRRDELGVLGGLVDAVREGESRVLVVRGEPGVGKTTLLEHVAGREHGCQVARAAGVQS